ncbi:MAG: rod shape-determining protein MreD [Pseudomonadota bacterium]
MGDRGLWRLAGYRALYVAAVLAVAVVLLLPLGSGAGRLPGPDIILALTIAWAMRQPAHVPLVLLAGTLLIADFLLMRPPGLMAVIIVLAVEVIRAREESWRDLQFMTDWAVAAALIAAIIVINAVCLAIFLVPQPSLGQTVIRLVLTILIYPAAMGAVLYIFGVRHVSGRPGTAGARA